MSSDASPVLTAQDVGKCYRVFARPSDRLREALFGRFGRRYGRDFWALRGVSFQLARGRALALIGRNGSGKSTLLQILAGTLPPTTGRVEVNGRVGALLELGSGFNPEFSGRENVHLQGVLLGLTRREVQQRFDEIIAFAEVGEALDQPVKTYSSGMFVRLAFAVQAVLSPEVLIVDEALAVGDAAFQIKCMAHMRRRLGEGMSIILASHDMETVRGLCSEAIWVHAGEVRQQGDPKDVTTAYLRFLFDGQPPPGVVADAAASSAPPTASSRRMPTDGGLAPLTDFATRKDLRRWGTGAATITGMRLAAVDGDDVQEQFAQGVRLRLEFAMTANAELRGDYLGLAFSIRNLKALQIITYTTWDAHHRLPSLRAGDSVRMSFEFDNVLARGEYELVLAVEDLRDRERVYHDYIENAQVLRVTSDMPPYSVAMPRVTCQLLQAPSSA